MFLKGDDVDIDEVPNAVWHVNDGGRYIGTGCYSVTMDPDERWVNVGCYRAMIQDGKKRQPTHGARQARLHASRKIFQTLGQKMPIGTGDWRRSAVFLYGRN